MITVGEACILGVVQGLTEFLPVSSDGHLALAHRFVTPVPAAQMLAIDVALHAGTLVALIAYFRHDLWQMVQAIVVREAGWARTWPWLLLIGTIPAGFAGILFKRQVEQSFASLPVIGVSFLLTGTLLYMATAVRGTLRGEGEVGAGDALFIGAFQALALLPGVSRSGTTIAAGLFRQLRPEVAARFSFLLGIPAIAGALIVESRDLFAIGPAIYLPVVAGVGAAAVTGFAAIWALIRVLRARRLHYFAFYCWALGAVVLIAASVGGT